MSQDYYSYAPLLRLPRPVAIYGLPGCRIETLAALMSRFSGVPFLSVDRDVSRAVGLTIDGVVLKRGAHVRRDLERKIVPAMVAQRTPGVIALGDTTLDDLTMRRRLHETCDVLRIHRPRQLLVHNIQAAYARSPANHARLHLGQPPTAEGIEPWMAEREAAQAGWGAGVVDLGTTTPADGAWQVMRHLGWELPEWGG